MAAATTETIEWGTPADVLAELQFHTGAALECIAPGILGTFDSHLLRSAAAIYQSAHPSCTPASVSPAAAPVVRGYAAFLRDVAARLASAGIARGAPEALTEYACALADTADSLADDAREPQVRDFSAELEGLATRAWMAQQSVVIFGAGNMGSMISALYARAGCEVTLVDAVEAQLDAETKAKYKKEIAALTSDEAERDAALGRIHTRALRGRIADEGNEALRTLLSGASLILEAAKEDRAVKEDLVRDLLAHTGPGAIIATNTSSLLVSEIVPAPADQARVCAIHYLQRGMPVAEVAPAPGTAPDTIDTAAALLRGSGMIPIHLNAENRGYIFNVIWEAIKEGALTELADNVAEPHAIDRLWMAVWGAKFGPCGAMDLVGYDTVKAILKVWDEQRGSKSTKLHAFLDDMIASERGGAFKTGRGLYDYRSAGAPFKKPGFIELGTEAGRGSTTMLTTGSLCHCWNLVEFTAEDANGNVIAQPMGPNPEGEINYHSDGRVDVLLRPAGSLDPAQAIDYKARWRVGLGGEIVHDVYWSSRFPHWVGKPQIRYGRIEGDRLILRTPPLTEQGLPPGARYRLVWKLAGS